MAAFPTVNTASATRMTPRGRTPDSSPATNGAAIAYASVNTVTICPASDTVVPRSCATTGSSPAIT